MLLCVVQGILRNLSSAGLEARKKMRDVVGLIDAMLYVIRLSLGKPGTDPKVKPKIRYYKDVTLCENYVRDFL